MTEPSRPSRNPKWQASGVRQSPTQSRETSRRNKIIAVVFAMLVLSGAIAAWVFWPTSAPQPYTLPVWVSDYTDRRVPVNAWATQDRKAWEALPLKHNSAFTSQQKELLVRELGRLEAVEDLSQPVIVYLSGYAVTDPDGKVFLLPSDADLNEPASWLAVADVLKNLRVCKAKHKLLILDIFGPFTDPPSGVLQSDAAARLEDDVKKATQDDPTLQVFASCSPGQVSLVSEDLGHSVFAYFLLRALSGEADGSNAENRKDARVDVAELVSFVTGSVDRWAWSNRRQRQTPVLYGAAADYALASTEQAAPPGPAPLEATYPAWLAERWALRDALWADQSFRVAPVAFRELELALRRADRQWRGGVEREKIEKSPDGLDDRVAQLEAQIKGAKKALKWSERDSLVSEAAVNGQKLPEVPDDLRYDLDQLAEVYARTLQAKPDDKDKAKFDMDSAALLKKFEGKPTDLAWTLFTVLRDRSNPRPAQVQLFAELLRKNPKIYDEKLKPYTEVRFLVRLAAIKATSPRDWPAEAVHNGLVAVDAAERAWASHPRALPWVEAALTQAGKDQKKGEDLLFAESSESREKAEKALDEVGKSYQMINAQLKIVQDAQLARDEAFVMLPAFVSYLDTGSDATDLLDPWQEAMRSLLKLQAQLVLPEDPAAALPERLGEMENLQREWQSARKKLELPLAAARRKGLMDKSKRPTPADWWEMSALLELPWLSAKDRAELGTAWRGLGGRLQQEKADGPLPSLELATSQRQERDRGLVRAKCSVALLRLTISAPEAFGTQPVRTAEEKKARTEAMAKLEKALSEAADKPGAASWSAMERQLRDAWKPYRSARAGGK